MHRGLTLRLPRYETTAVTVRKRDDDSQSVGNPREGRCVRSTDFCNRSPIECSQQPSSAEQKTTSLASDQTSEPVILLDVMRLAGYLPSENDQAEAMIESLRTAIFGGSGLYQEGKLMNLFLTKKAKHGILSGNTTQNEHLELSYPEVLREGVTTKEVWEKLNDPHEIPVVQRVLGHLTTCQQPLLWKFDMRHELLRIVDEEMSFRDLEDWKTRRSAELEQLYMVRETIEHRVKLAENEEACLIAERDQAVVEQMRHRAGLTSFDLHSTVFCFPEDDHEIMGFSTIPSTYDASYFGKEEERSDEESGWNQTNGDNKLELEELRHTEKLREATDIENSVLEECTSSALRVAMAKVTALKKRLEEVDELLESLQDEEWAEADGEGDSSQLKYPHPRDSVLTPILAMVLGASDTQQASLVQEHRAIIQAWEAFFGRLPPMPIDESKKEVERENFGIVENEGDWEDLDDATSAGDELSKTN